LSPGGAAHFAWAKDLQTAELRKGTLYIVSTPIGNVEDISIRALRVLKSVSIIAAENPTVTRTLLRHYHIDTPITGFRSRADDPVRMLIDRLRTGETVALVCDAGTPLIADAGARVVQSARAAGVPMEVVPGPTAGIAALVVAASSAGRFAVDGFPPRGRADRGAFFTGLGSEIRTIVLYETRRYLRDTLARLHDSMGPDRSILVAQDLTKPSEFLFYGTLAQAHGAFQSPPAGEFTLVIS